MSLVMVRAHVLSLTYCPVSSQEWEDRRDAGTDRLPGQAATCKHRTRDCWAELGWGLWAERGRGWGGAMAGAGLWAGPWLELGWVGLVTSRT